MRLVADKVNKPKRDARKAAFEAAVAEAIQEIKPVVVETAKKGKYETREFDLPYQGRAEFSRKEVLVEAAKRLGLSTRETSSRDILENLEYQLIIVIPQNGPPLTDRPERLS